MNKTAWKTTGERIMSNRYSKYLAGLAALGVALIGQAMAQNKAEKRDMELVGYSSVPTLFE